MRAYPPNNGYCVLLAIYLYYSHFCRESTPSQLLSMNEGKLTGYRCGLRRVGVSSFSTRYFPCSRFWRTYSNFSVYILAMVWKIKYGTPQLLFAFMNLPWLIRLKSPWKTRSIVISFQHEIFAVYIVNSRIDREDRWFRICFSFADLLYWNRSLDKRYKISHQERSDFKTDIFSDQPFRSMSLKIVIQKRNLWH